ncbi:MAG: AAA family ATPase, partial [Eubacterium sp.]|nr:AAA family ATPase [Eubacterium sp.]
MSNSAVLNQIIKMGLGTPIGLIGGFAKLISMDQGVLDTLFSSEEEKADLQAIHTIMEEYEIDVNLLKQGAPLLSLMSTEQDKKELEKYLAGIESSGKSVIAADVLKDLLTWNIPELELVKKGHNMSHILDYSDKNKDKSMEKRKQEKPAKEAPAAKTPAKNAEKKNEPAEKQTASEKTEEASDTSADQTQETEEASTDLSMLIKRVKRLTECLKLQIKGQNEAIRLFAEGYFQSEVFKEEDRKGPSATFLFAGPPGVGKTFLAETAAANLNMAHLRLDMSEFASHDSVKRLVGTEKHFAGSAPGVLTSFVKENPRSIILLDEIEKAEEDVIYQFLQVMDGGVLTDAMTKEQIDFKNTILIFTTNVGKSLYESRDRINLSGIPRAVVIKALEEEKNEYGKNRFPAAICSRFAAGNVIMFNHLETHILQEITSGKFTEAADHIRSLYDINTKYDSRLAAMFLYTQSVNLDARNISAQSTILVKNELYEFGRNLEDVHRTVTDLKKLVFTIELPEDNPEIQQLFHNEEQSSILLFGDKNTYEGVPFSEKCNVKITDSIQEMLETIGDKDISFVVIDLNFGLEVQHQYLSMDDWDSVGIQAFNELREKLPQIPVYILQNSNLRTEDANTFTSRGARGFLDICDKTAFANSIAEICNQSYMQKKVYELSDRGRILSYNTAQRILDDGQTAEIKFYDFKTRLATSGEENQMMIGDNNRPKERFEDVIGAESAKKEMEYFVKFLKNPKKYMANGSKPPKGILLYGPPGTGKTMLARAMAGESDVPFFAASATGFMDRYFGESERKIRQLFATARKFAPSIVFIDEIDAIGKERTGSEHTHITEEMLNALLIEMDGFNKNPAKPVFVVAATNFDLDGSVSGKERSLDPALLRRFDNRVYVDLPKENERLKYMQIQLQKIKEHAVTDNALQSIATRTTGESLSILKDVLDLALRNATREEKVLDDTILLKALDEYLYGEERENKEDYYKSVSIHESGHAYIYTLGGWKPSFVTIISRGNFGGYMQHENSEDTPSYTKEQLLWRIRTALAGRAAEMEFFGETEGTNTGISSDIQNATNIAMNMVCRYAMAEDHLISLPPEQILKTARGEKLLDTVEQILQEQMIETRKLVHEGRDKIQALAEFLQRQNQATEAE